MRARSKKRAAVEEIGVDAEFIDHLVEAFYAKIRSDDLLGPIFAARISDWPSHLGRMKAFWRSVLHNSGEFSGNPMLKHLTIPGVSVEHFAHWLELFYETLRDAEAQPAATTLVGARARMIADSLLTAIMMRRDGLAGGRAGERTFPMPEALLKEPHEGLRQFRDPMGDLSTVLPPLEQNDNEPASAPSEG